MQPSPHYSDYMTVSPPWTSNGPGAGEGPSDLERVSVAAILVARHNLARCSGRSKVLNCEVTILLT
jgi:hypothetical protein